MRSDGGEREREKERERERRSWLGFLDWGGHGVDEEEEEVFSQR